MKKILVTVLATITLLGCLAGCGAKESEPTATAEPSQEIVMTESGEPASVEPTGEIAE